MVVLSIIVPVYNSAKYLRECLESLINQTYKDIEIVCVNDGSTDNSLDILNEYAQKDNRIKIICQKNEGTSSARNLGYKNSVGKYVTFVDSDDILDLDAYEIALNSLGDNDLLCFGLKVFGTETRQQKNFDDIYYRIKFQGEQTVTQRKIRRTDVSASNKIFKRSIIDKYKISFPVGCYYEDAEFFYTYAINCNKIFYLQKYLYNYRRSEKSIMAETFQGTPKAIDHLFIVKHIFDYFVNWNKLKNNTDLFLWIFKNYFNMAYKNSDKNTKPTVLKLATEYAFEFDKYLKNKSNFIKALKNKNYDYTYIPDLKWYQKLYKSKKVYDVFNNREMIIKYFLGFRFETLQPKISVLMPAYNAEKHIREAINSILNQTYTNFEFIIINDGSTDNTANIIREYNDQRIVFIDNKTNQGLVSVLNYGLDIAKGKYIARMDADDISYPKRFEKQVRFLEKHDKVGIVGSWYKAFGSKNFVEKKKRFPKLKDMTNSPFAHPTVMLHKSFFDKYNLRYNEQYKHAEDYELWVKASKYMKFANIQEVLLDYRWSDSNISTVHEKEQTQRAEVIKQRVRNQVCIRKRLLKIWLDDSQLLRELSSLGKFSYIPILNKCTNTLTASATMYWFDKNSLQWKFLQNNTPPNNLVLGGCVWNETENNQLTTYLDVMKDCKKVVILPSSFINIQKLSQIMDSRFTIFCKEKTSFDYLKSLNTNAKILLDDDMLLRLRRFIKVRIAPTKNLRKLSKQLQEKISILSKNSATLKWNSAQMNIPEYNFGTTRKNIDFITSELLKILSKFDNIETNDLEIGIAGTLLVKEVNLYENSAQKVADVYAKSLQILPNVQIK